MSKSVRSVFIFGLYLGLLGVALLTIPNTLLGIFHLPPVTDVWIRVVGMLLFLLAYYYVQAARREMTDFFRWTAHARTAVFFFLAVFVLLKLVDPIIILLGVVDLSGAVWTHLALRGEKTSVRGQK